MLKGVLWIPNLLLMTVTYITACYAAVYYKCLPVEVRQMVSWQPPCKPQFV